MVSIGLEAGSLHVALTRAEKLSALRRADVVIPLPHIRCVEAVADPIRLVHGLRAPGLGLPGRTKIGTWRSKGRKTFAVTHKASPGLRITLQGSTFDEILLSVRGSVELSAQIAAQLPLNKSSTSAGERTTSEGSQRPAGTS